MLSYRYLLSICLITIMTMPIISQEVSVSDELSIRNYFSYELLGQIEDRILVYRDKGFSKEVDVYNEDMEHTQFSEFIFEKKKADVYAITGLDTSFQMIYGFVDKDSLIIKMREYDKLVRLIDSTTLTKVHKKEIRRRYSYNISRDRSKILLTTVLSNNQIQFLNYNCRQKRLTWNQTILFDAIDYRDFDDIILTNDGHVIIQLNSDNLDRNRIDFLLLDPYSNKQFNFRVDFGDHLYNDAYFDYDDKHKNIVVAGNYSDSKGRQVQGLYYYRANINNLQSSKGPKFIPYTEGLGQELLQGKRRNKKHVFDDLEVQNIIFRNDGGALVMTEISKDFSRRSPYNSSFTRDVGGGVTRRGWVDYYNEDIVMININPNLEVDWTKVLYKKQFSQDDEAVFSSFYVMKTPSRLRLIYNDDIKKNSTVSEYLLDPAGRIARNSLLSTEYQDMKLRFMDAVQLSSNSILVPSEQNFNLNLVKITY